MSMLRKLYTMPIVRAYTVALMLSAIPIALVTIVIVVHRWQEPGQRERLRHAGPGAEHRGQ